MTDTKVTISVVDSSSSSKEGNYDEVVESFDDMELKEELLRGIYGFGFEKPSAIQKSAVAPCTTGKDVTIQSQAGSGKTVISLIDILQGIDCEDAHLQVILLAPQRGMAQRAHEQLKSLGRNLNVNATCLGFDTTAENDKISHVLMGTPKDFLSNIPSDTSRIKMFVLDEADEMLSKGFKDQIYEVFRSMPQDVQVVLLSATMPSEVLDVTNRFMRDPIRILVKKDELTLEGIRQFYINVQKDEWKFNCLCDLLKTSRETQALIFCNTRRRVTQLTEQLMSIPIKVSCFHGNMEHNEREDMVKDFNSRNTRVLVTTDLMARGMNIRKSLIINYDVSGNMENYMLRNGRQGNFGSKGLPISFFTENDISDLKKIENHYSTRIEEMPESFLEYLDEN